MAASSGPDIADSGLVLAFDAADINSFDKYENLMTNSQLGNTILNDGSGVTLTTDTSIINPFGVYDGVLKCVHTTNTPGYFRRGQNMSLTAGVTYTFSFFFKNGTVVSPYGQSPIYIGVLASTYSPTFQDLSQSLNTTISFPDGWYRQVFTFTPGYTQTYQIDFNQANNQTPIGTYYLYGFQLERGSSVSTYYQTTATAKTRGSTIIDLSGNGNTGTLTNGPTYSSSNGGSIVFDGVDDTVSVTDNNSLDFGTSDFSVGFFLYVPSANLTATTEYGVINKNPYFENNAGWGIELSTYGQSSPYNTVSIQFYNTGQTAWGNSNVLYTLLKTNIWNYVMATRSSTTGTLYINGSSVVQKTNNDIGINVNNSSNIIFASHSWGPNFKGNISQVSIYNRALSATEIQQNFNAVRSRFGI